MLEILSTKPYPKFILIQDNVSISASRLLLSILSNHVLLETNDIYLICAENHPDKYKPRLGDTVKYINLTNDTESNTESILSTILQCEIPAVVFIDSMSEVAWRLGANIFQILQRGLQNSNLLQLATILHEDCTPVQLKLQERLSHIAAVNVKLYILNNQQRLSLLYNKPSGKLVKTELQFEFLNNQIVAKKISMPFKKETEPTTTTPESLATFRIGLGDAEKESRDKVVLPYIKAKESSSNRPINEGKVFYELDEADDWDEEDPDDDLDV